MRMQVLWPFIVSIGSESVHGGSSEGESDEDDDLQRAYN